MHGNADSVFWEADSAYQALLRRGMSPAHIILWGHSLASAPAVELESRRPAAARV
jgi:hypothetical protein